MRMQSEVPAVAVLVVCFFQAEDGIRDLVRSRGLGDVYKRQQIDVGLLAALDQSQHIVHRFLGVERTQRIVEPDLSLIHI